MKTTNQTSIMMAIVLLSFSINSCKEENIPPSPDGVMLTNNTITLYVETDKIDRTNLDATCNFGQPAGISNEDFTTLVKLGDDITWVGESTIEGDIVNIELIKHDKGDRILKDRRNRGDRKVKGKVTKGNKDDVEKYTIKFTVIHNGIISRPYRIDPKLQI